MFEGSFVALVTPFADDESLDESKLKELLEFQIEGGTDGIVPCGTTGESPALTDEEHNRVVDLTVQTVDGRTPVLAGTGSNSTTRTLHATEHAKASGADGVLIVTPYYNKPTQNGLYAHYMKIADSVDIPIIIYNVPGRCGTDILSDTVARLAEHPNIAGLKEATGDLKRASEVVSMCPDDFVVLSGDDVNTLPILSVGGKGVISVVANVAPTPIAELCGAFKAGNVELARKLHYETMPLAVDLFVETNPIPAKTALMLMGKLNGKMRLPLAPMAPANLEQLRRTLEFTNLI
ncbi:MAG: 4-hydroxy-tetrahydrodipicolinate synthase [Candidatus Poribacteria bacterium]|nr:4-hydroxy-tetrahydrodipicolinate synthase [Candidatus Poribacteria bacterium]MDE0505151.1 4-hydroxy-tetrahydrodipicolinate synthase [Candidatus Poribacteria bacterium]